MKRKEVFIISKISLIAILTALCFGATFINVPLPTGDCIHLGNFVMIVSALLLGGIEGGLIGSLGMGLFDLIMYSSKPTTIIRTFILKFLIGLIVGIVFRLILKKKIKTEKLLIISSVIFFLLSGITLTIFLLGDFTNFGLDNGLSTTLIILGSTKTFTLSLFVPIFSLLFSIGMIVAFIISKNLSTRSKAALFSVTLAILVNILGEFFLRFLLEGIYNIEFLELSNGFDISLAVATSKIPGSLVTGFISVFFASIVYEPVYFGLKRLSEFEDDTKGLIVEEENDDIEDTIDEDTNVEAI